MNSRYEELFDVAIIGAGPAGCSTAISLHGSGLKVALIDKSTFPRDKICGDAISPDVVSQLQKLPLAAGKHFDQLEEKITCTAVRFISPNYSHADLSLRNHNITGYVSPRLAFDQFMFERASSSDVQMFTGNQVQKLQDNGTDIQIIFHDNQQIRSKLVIGADGANSAVARQLAKHEIDRNHHCAGLRQYWENVSGFSNDNAVELHFYKELLPGYFWMFPLPGNKANIGLGMLSAHIHKKKPNLKAMLKDIIENHPNVKDRFVNARPLEEIKGFNLPLGSRKRTISGNRYLLLGDAASLINPLSGEGIANAIRSGRVAAEHAKNAFECGRFDEKFNAAYDREIYSRLWRELQLNYWIQLAMRRPALSNFIVQKAIGNAMVQDMVMSGFNTSKIKRSLMNPMFYLRLLRNKS